MNPASNPPLYACLYAADFPVQALLRLRPDLRTHPVAILEGRAPLEFVCSLNRYARLAGATPGMTRVEAEHIPHLHLLPRSFATEASARFVVFECAANFAPQIEDVSGSTTCAGVLDITGTERLFGPPETLARRLRATLVTAGFRASVVISNNFHGARLKAAACRGITVIPTGDESSTLAPLPIGLLNLDEDSMEIFSNWGIRTLGELATLPESELVVRLGDRACRWRNLACGIEPHTFQPINAAFALEEQCDLETPVDRADSLLFLGSRMIDCLASRASSRALALASLTMQMALEGGGVYRRIIRPAVPTVDRKFLLKLLQLELAAHPPQAAVVQFALSAEAGHTSKVQLGLFMPQTPEPSRMDVTIARLKAIAGADRVGTPVLEDTHRPSRFHLKDFVLSDAAQATSAADKAQPRAALRRMRPPLPVRVSLRAEKPVSFRTGQCDYTVSTAYGPWRTSGCWWTTEAWDVEEWDVLAERRDSYDHLNLACLLVHDRAHHQWRLEAFYD
jgi:protein ImuB